MNGSFRGMLMGTPQSRRDTIRFGSRYLSTSTDHGAQTRPEPPIRPVTGMRHPVNRETGRNPLHGVDVAPEYKAVIRMPLKLPH